MDIDTVNSISSEEFINNFKNVIEKYEKCAEYLCKGRPYKDLQDVQNAAHAFLDALSPADVEEVICLHPDLTGDACDDTNLTLESQEEQRAAGLRDIDDNHTSNLNNQTMAYKRKFGFPFIICAKENKFEAIINGLTVRLKNTKEEELRAALEEIKKIVAYRLQNLVH